MPNFLCRPLCDIRPFGFTATSAAKGFVISPKTLDQEKSLICLLVGQPGQQSKPLASDEASQTFTIIFPTFVASDDSSVLVVSSVVDPVGLDPLIGHQNTSNWPPNWPQMGSRKSLNGCDSNASQIKKPTCEFRKLAFDGGEGN